MASIHPTAIVHPDAGLGDGVSIGPYCTVGAHCTLGDDVELVSHVVLDGHTVLGRGVRVFPFASIGVQPQDLKYAGEESELQVGEGTIIREHVTAHTGTAGGGLMTRIGARCLLMVGCHVAHDCQLGDEVILVNNVLLGGHVEIGNSAIVGGGSAIHQFARIGRHAMIGGASGVEGDVIPYGSVMGNRARLSGLNLIGLRRRGYARSDIHELRKAYRLLFADEGTFQERLEQVEDELGAVAPVRDVIDFIRVDSSRALVHPGRSDG